MLLVKLGLKLREKTLFAYVSLQVINLPLNKLLAARIVVRALLVSIHGWCPLRLLLLFRCVVVRAVVEQGVIGL